VLLSLRLSTDEVDFIHQQRIGRGRTNLLRKIKDRSLECDQAEGTRKERKGGMDVEHLPSHHDRQHDDY
jgi:hypothetical protein